MGAPSRFPYPHRCPQPLGALRLHLAPGDGPGLAGRWWPYSRDLTREGPHLVDQFPLERGRVDRLVYAADDWRSVADELFTSHGRMKVGFFPPGRAGGTVLLRLVGAGTITLRVAWPDPDVLD
jgi:hypothetical protein